MAKKTAKKLTNSPKTKDLEKRLKALEVKIEEIENKRVLVLSEGKSRMKSIKDI